ncbi:MAG: L-rhamnose mutarotase, partial [Candidatus Hinthialibacter sp.]
MKRYGMVIGIKEEKIDEYKKMHESAWRSVLDMISECHIKNYSIFLGQLDDGKYYLFSYFEYTGLDFEGDMAKMAADPITQECWSYCEPCQIPLANRKQGAWW